MAITIGATDDQDILASFSDTGNSLDFVAPGVDIYTASFDNPTQMNGFHVSDGTSLATPMVAGIASLAHAIRPGLTRQELMDALSSTAIDLGAPGWDSSHGWGRVDASGAVACILQLENHIFSDGFESGDTSNWSSP